MTVSVICIKTIVSTHQWDCLKQTKSNHLKKGDYSNYREYLLHNELNIAFWFSLQVFDLCREGYPCDPESRFSIKRSKHKRTEHLPFPLFYAVGKYYTECKGSQN